MEKGVLLERNGRTGIVLTPQGEFRRVSLPQGAWEIGDEIALADRAPVPWIRWGVVAAAAALLLLLAPVGYSNWTLAQPFAVATVDINPSVELTLNRNDQVIDVRALNEDGRLVLTGVDWKRLPLERVVTSLVSRAVEEKKLNPGDAAAAVVVTVASATGQELAVPKAEALLDRSREAAGKAVAEKARERSVEAQATVVALVATVPERKEAKEKAASMGQVLLAARLQVTVEELKQSGPAAILKQKNENPSQVLKELEKALGTERVEEKKGGGKKSDTGSPGSEPAKPASGTPSQTEQNRGQSDKSPPGQSQTPGKPDAPGRSESPGQSENKGQGGSQPGGRGNDSKENKNSTPDSKGNEKKENGKSNSSDTIRIPFTTIDVSIPSLFRRDEGPATNPRADSPGAGSSSAPVNKGSENPEAAAESRSGQAGSQGLTEELVRRQSSGGPPADSPKGKSEPDPKADAKPGTKAESGNGSRVEPKPETKPAEKSETKAGTRSEEKAATKPDAKSGAQPDTRTESDPDRPADKQAPTTRPDAPKADTPADPAPPRADAAPPTKPEPPKTEEKGSDKADKSSGTSGKSGEEKPADSGKEKGPDKEKPQEKGN